MTVYGYDIHTTVAVYSPEVRALVLFHWFIPSLYLTFVRASECRDIKVLNALLQWRPMSRTTVMHVTIASCTETLRVCDMFIHVMICRARQSTALYLIFFLRARSYVYRT